VKQFTFFALAPERGIVFGHGRERTRRRTVRVICCLMSAIKTFALYGIPPVQENQRHCDSSPMAHLVLFRNQMQQTASPFSVALRLESILQFSDTLRQFGDGPVLAPGAVFPRETPQW
jgi:hypothetical protein